MSNEKALKKELTFASALSTVISLVIGAGIFFKATTVFGATKAPGLAIVAWIVAGILTILGGLTIAELSASIPKTGGIVTYLKEIYGDKLGAVTGWMLSVVYYPGISAALGFFFASEVVSFLGLQANLTTPIALITILFVAAINTLGSKASGIVQTVATAVKLIPLAIIIIIGFTKGTGGASNLAPFTSSSVSTFPALGAALIATLFAYDGWISVGNIAGEMKNPAKDLPKAIVLGLSIVILVYVGINAAFLWVLPASEFIKEGAGAPATMVAQHVLGAGGAKFVSAGIIISVFGTLNANILTGPRALYSLAQNKSIPFHGFFGRLSSKNVPAVATWTIAILACLYGLSGKVDFLTDIPVFITWVFYILAFVGVMILRKRNPEMVRPYKVPLYPVIPVLAILGGLYVVVSTFMNQPINALIGIGVTVLGLPLYLIANKSK